MLRIRLRRAGKKNQPFFKMVVVEKKSPPKGGRPVEVVGFCNPLTKERGLKKERIKYWLSVGAQPSDAVHNMLATEGIIKGDKIDVHKKAKTEKKEPVQTAVKTAAIESEAETQETIVEALAGKQEQEAEEAEPPKLGEKKVEEAKPEQEPAAPEEDSFRQDEDKASESRPEDPVSEGESGSEGKELTKESKSAII